jgi:hypothetical protein
MAFSDRTGKTRQFSLPFGDHCSALEARSLFAAAAAGRQANRRRETTMVKGILNLFGALLLTAALAAATTPARAQDIPDIQQNATCQQKVEPDSWWLCGRVPADGHITYTNVGIHHVTVFTTGSGGIGCAPHSSTTSPSKNNSVSAEPCKFSRVWR